MVLEEWLPKHLEANHNLTLEEHREAFEEEFGEEVSTSTIGRAMARLPDGGWPLKRSRVLDEGPLRTLRARSKASGWR